MGPWNQRLQVDAKPFAVQGMDAFQAIAGGHWEKGLQLITKAGISESSDEENGRLRRALLRWENSLIVQGQVLNKAHRRYDC